MQVRLRESLYLTNLARAKILEIYELLGVIIISKDENLVYIALEIIVLMT